MKTEAYKILSALLLSLMFFSCGKEDEFEKIEDSRLTVTPKPYVYYEATGAEVDTHQTHKVRFNVVHNPEEDGDGSYYEEEYYLYAVRVENTSQVNDKETYSWLNMYIRTPEQIHKSLTIDSVYNLGQIEEDSYPDFSFNYETNNIKRLGYNYILYRGSYASSGFNYTSNIDRDSSEISFSLLEKDKIEGFFKINFTTPNRYEDHENFDINIINGEFTVNFAQ